jgi:hypothetical protein
LQALGGKMTTYELLQKNIGKTFPFEVDGVRWVCWSYDHSFYKGEIGIVIVTDKKQKKYRKFIVVYSEDYNTYSSHDDKDKALIKQALKAIEEASHGKG